MKSPVETAKETKHKYAPDEDIPLEGFSALLITYATTLVGVGLVARMKGRRLPERFKTHDLAIGSAAVYKISRTLTKDSVTSPIRAPFTEFDGPAGNSELKEHVRGSGLRKAVGELITCPFCAGQWVSTFMAIGLALWPKQTRFIASVFAMKAGSDFLQFGQAAMKKLAS